MAYDAKTERLIALKKLAGKAQTSNDKGLANEALPSGITATSETIFGETITATPSNAALYNITGKVEYIRFQVSFIPGSDTSSGRHGFELKLPSDYEANSTNPQAGSGVFVNDGVVNASGGKLQLVPPSFGTTYEAKPFYGGSSAKNSGTQIPLLDARDWYLDYYNGVFFQQDPSGTGAQPDNPDYLEAFLYIGSMLDTMVSSGAGGGDSDAEYLVLAATGSLSAERVFTGGTGINTADAGAGAAYTVSVDDRVVATLTGSQFSGNVGITGSFGATSTSIFGDNSSLSGADNNFFVSGAIDSRGTAERGTAVFGGDVVLSGTLSINRAQAGVGSFVTVTSDGKVGIGSDTPAYKLSVGGNMDVGEYIYHKNDSDTFIQFANDSIGVTAGGVQLITISEDPTFVKIGDGTDVDFQVRTLNDDNTLYVKGDTDTVGIGLNGPATKLHVFGSSPTVRIQRNLQSETSTLDFAGASGFPGASIAHAGSTNDLVFNVFNGSSVEEILRMGDYYSGNKRQVIFLSGSGMHSAAVQPEKCSDVAFFVSGSIGSRGSATLGTAVFGGDLVVSGAINVLDPIFPKKFAYVLSASHASDVNLDIPVLDFSLNEYSFDKNEVFLNGQLLTSGSSLDYVLVPPATGSVRFNFGLYDQDIVTVRQS